MTLSLVARCRETGRLGAAICSSSPAVAARCIRVRAGVGAACSQNLTDPTLAGAVLDALNRGVDAEHAVGSAVADTPHRWFRQLLCIGASGPGAAYSGGGAFEVAASSSGTDCVAAGNLLVSAEVASAMTSAFEDSDGQDIAPRLIRALEAGLEAGGEHDPVRSAGVVVADRWPWPVVDLRVDWDDDPVRRLSKLWRVWEPVMDDYVRWAVDPTMADHDSVRPERPDES